MARRISPEDREQVFEQGYSTGYGGSGVGLTTVSRIAQVHGLDVSLRESAEGAHSSSSARRTTER